MATPWPHGKLTNFTERDHKTRWEKSGFYEREELSWTFIGFVKALGIHLSSEYRICTCSRVKREEEREREEKKKERRVCKWRVILLERDSVGENCSWFLKLMASIIGLLTVIVSCINIHVHSLVIENGKYIFIEYSLFKYNIIRNIFYRNLFSSKLLQIEINFKTFKQKFCTCVSPIRKKILLRE